MTLTNITLSEPAKHRRYDSKNIIHKIQNQAEAISGGRVRGVVPFGMEAYREFWELVAVCILIWVLVIWVFTLWHFTELHAHL